jgi:geranylgeranyl diphosphate synthase type I
VLPALRQAADRLSPDLRTVVGYHQGWLDRHGRPAAMRSGKALRPALALLSTKAAGVSPEQGIPAAVAVELVHDFSLLHDDILDGDTERRHQPAAWTIFGAPTALLAGNAALAAALQVLLEHDSRHAAPAVRTLAETVQRLVAGQAMDLDFERRRDVTTEQYLAMAAGKTAALLSCSCSLGALMAGAAPATVAHLAEFGTHLGIAFQLVDDIHGIWGDADALGKPVLADLQVRKKSGPVVAALAEGTPAAARLAELYFRTDALRPHDLEAAASLIEQCGGRRWSEYAVARHLAEARRRLDAASIPPVVRAELLATARFVTALPYQEVLP